jgi:hypothetical protein
MASIKLFKQNDNGTRRPPGDNRHVLPEAMRAIRPAPDGSVVAAPFDATGGSDSLIGTGPAGRNA